MIGRIFTVLLIMGFMIVGHGASFEELQVINDNVQENLENKEFNTSSIYLSTGLNNILKGFGQAAVGFVYVGGWIYELFPVPEEYVDPIGLFFFFDWVLLGILSYIFIYLGMKLFFAGFLLLIEKVGLINWGGRE